MMNDEEDIGFVADMSEDLDNRLARSTTLGLGAFAEIMPCVCDRIDTRFCRSNRSQQNLGDGVRMARLCEWCVLLPLC